MTSEILIISSLLLKISGTATTGSEDRTNHQRHDGLADASRRPCKGCCNNGGFWHSLFEIEDTSEEFRLPTEIKCCVLRRYKNRRKHLSGRTQTNKQPSNQLTKQPNKQPKEPTIKQTTHRTSKPNTRKVTKHASKKGLVQGPRCVSSFQLRILVRRLSFSTPQNPGQGLGAPPVPGARADISANFCQIRHPFQG